jgi:hypothetical protein
MQKQETIGVRVVSKRKGMFKKRDNEIVVDIDRTNRVLGNPFILNNRHDTVERSNVIQKYRELIDADINAYGQKLDAILELTNIVLSGKNLALRCWCKEPDREVACHGDVIKEKIEEFINTLHAKDI